MDIVLKAQKGGDHDTQQDKAGGVAGGSPLRWGGGAPNVGGRLQRAGRLPLTYLHWVGSGHRRRVSAGSYAELRSPVALGAFAFRVVLSSFH